MHYCRVFSDWKSKKICHDYWTAMENGRKKRKPAEQTQLKPWKKPNDRTTKKWSLAGKRRSSAEWVSISSLLRHRFLRCIVFFPHVSVTWRNMAKRLYRRAVHWNRNTSLRSRRWREYSDLLAFKERSMLVAFSAKGKKPGRIYTYIEGDQDCFAKEVSVFPSTRKEKDGWCVRSSSITSLRILPMKSQVSWHLESTLFVSRPTVVTRSKPIVANLSLSSREASCDSITFTI